MRVANRKDSDNLKLVLVDLTTDSLTDSIFGVGIQHQDIFPLSDLGLVNSFFENSSSYFNYNGKIKEALENASHALNLDPSSHIARDVIASIMHAQGKIDEFLSITSQNWQKLAPDNIIRRLNALLGQGEANLNEFYESLQLCIDYPEAYLAVSDMLSMIGLHKEAYLLLSRPIEKIRKTLDSLYKDSATEIVAFSSQDGQKPGGGQKQAPIIRDKNSRIDVLEKNLIECLKKRELYKKLSE